MKKTRSAFTLVEVVVSMMLIGLLIIGIVQGWMFAHNLAETSAYSLAANSLSIQRMEQARSTKIDLLASPPVDELVQTNFPPVTNILDVPMSGDNIPYAVTFTTIEDLPGSLKLIRAETVWSMVDRGPFTNAIQTYRAAQ